MSNQEFAKFVAGFVILCNEHNPTQEDVLRALTVVLNGRRSKEKPRKG